MEIIIGSFRIDWYWPYWDYEDMNPVLAKMLISVALGAVGAFAVYMLTSRNDPHCHQNPESDRRRRRARAPSPDCPKEAPSHSYNLRRKAKPVRDNSSEEDVDEPKCEICFETFKTLKISGVELNSTFCGHVFCEPCLKRHLGTYKHCPICRRSLQQKDVHKIYL